MNLEKLFSPESIAVVGASEEEGKVGNVIAKNIIKLGYKGEVFLVNPKHENIFSQKCYKSLSEVKGEVDLAILAIPAKLILIEVEKNADKIKNYVIISAGFSETGEEGKLREEKLLELAKEKNLNILGPNCLGFIVPKLKLNASFAGSLPEPGSISFVSQSGALAVALMDTAKKEGIKFSNIISIGNKMQISEAEILQYLSQDKDTKVIGMYLEGVKKGSDFIEIATCVSKLKPVIILKAGKSAKTQKAILSHTGALAGDNDIISAIFKKTGVLRANNLEEFFDLFNLMESSHAPDGNKTAVITNAGGVGVLTADAFDEKSIQLAELSLETKKELRGFLPAESSVENPIDLLGDAKEDRYAGVLETISKVKEIGSIICVLTPQDQTPVEKIADSIIEFKNKTKKVVIAVFLGGEKVESAVKKLKENGIYNFKFPDNAACALDGYWRWSEFQKLKIKTAGQIANAKRKEKVLNIIKTAKAEGRGALYFSEAKKVMGMYGVDTASYHEILPGNEFFGYPTFDFGYPVALKVDSEKFLHKTDKKGLILDIRNQEQLENSIQEMKNNFPRSRLIVQPIAERGTELIIGVKHDKIFGPVVVYGLGGIYTEILRWVDYLVPPLPLGQIEESLIQGKLKFLFSGVRSQKKYNLEELARILLGIVFMSLEIPEIREFDINPLLVYNDGKKAKAVDVKIII